MLAIALTILRNNWKQIIMAIAIAGVIYTGYNWVWERGYNTATVECQTLLDKQAKEREERMEALTGYARSNLEQSLINNQKVIKELADIKAASKGKATTVIINGDCKPSPDFVQTYNQAIAKGNSK